MTLQHWRERTLPCWRRDSRESVQLFALCVGVLGSKASFVRIRHIGKLAGVGSGALCAPVQSTRCARLPPSWDPRGPAALETRQRAFERSHPDCALGPAGSGLLDRPGSRRDRFSRNRCSVVGCRPSSAGNAARLLLHCTVHREATPARAAHPRRAALAGPHLAFSRTEGRPQSCTT